MSPFAKSPLPNQRRSVRSLSRRTLFKRASLAAAALAMPSIVRAAPAPITVNVCEPPFNADYTGVTDCSNSFQYALNVIMGAGQGAGGRLWVPMGTYRLGKPLSYTGSILIEGMGQASSVLLVTHTKTALTVTCPSPFQSYTMRDMGFSPAAAGAAGTALSLNFHADNVAGWERCCIDNVDFGVATPGYTTFMNCLRIANGWRCNLRNINAHSNAGSVPGSVFLSLNGLKNIDNRFTNCYADGFDVGYLVNSYSEGLHWSDCVTIANSGLTTGTTSYTGTPGKSAQINVLQLEMSNCEFNCQNVGANLFQVASGTISGTHFGINNPGSALALAGTTNLQVTGCTFSGQLNVASPADYVGVSTSAGVSGWCAIGNLITGCQFTNLLVGVNFQPNSINNVASGVMQFGPGGLVSSPIRMGGMYMQPVLDQSGNSTNVGQSIG